MLKKNLLSFVIKLVTNFDHHLLLQSAKKEETNDQLNSISKFQSRKMKIYKNNYFENEKNLLFTVHVSLDYSVIIAILSYVFYTIVINIYYIHVHIAVFRQW